MKRIIESAHEGNLERIVKKSSEVERELGRRVRRNNFTIVRLNAEKGNGRVKVEEFIERDLGRYWERFGIWETQKVRRHGTCVKGV